MDQRSRFRRGFAVSLLVALWVTLTSSATLFAQTGPDVEAPLPAPRRLPAGAPVQEPSPKQLPATLPVEEPAPAPREVIGLFDTLPPASLSEEPAPMPRTQTPAPPPLLLPSASRAPVPSELQRLHQEIEGLRLEREAMLLEEMELISAKEVKAGNGDENALIRGRITQLLLRAAKQNQQTAAARHQHADAGRSPPNPPARKQGDERKSSPSPLAQNGGKGSKHHPSSPKRQKGVASEGEKHPAQQPDNSSQVLTDAPVDPLSLAQSLFLSGDHAAALKAYRQLEQEEQKPSERVAIQYMIACCLRKLGKLDEAAMLYREVASSGGNDILVENAQWYLRAMKDRRELDAQLDELRQRRQALMPRKP